MKSVKMSCVAMTILLLSSINEAQAQLNNIGVRQLSATQLANLKVSPIGWYFDKVERPATSGASGSIKTKTVGTNRSEVGVNLPRVQNVIAPNGQPSYAVSSSGYCETQAVKMDYLNESAFSLVNINETFSPLIFPGSFIEAGSLLEKRPVFYSRATERAPLTVGISVSNPKSKAPTEISISDFGANNIDQLNTELRNKHFGAAISPVYAFSLTEITSTEHFTATLNYSAGLMLPLEEFGLPIDLSQGVKVNVSGSGDKKMHSYMVSFIQPMYAYSVKEVDMNRFFNRAGLASQHSTAGYVSSVIFGRMVLLTFQSTEDSATVDALISQRLGVSFTSGELANAKLGVNVDGTVKTNFTNKVKNFKAFVYGGDAATALKLTSNPEDVYAFIQNASAYTLSATSGALPIQYVINRVSDGRALGVRSTSSFSMEDCLNPRFDVDVIYKGIKCNKVVEAPFDNEEDIFGSVKVADKTLFTIAENNALSIKAGDTKKADVDPVRVKSSQTINDIKNLKLTFAPNVKDWELLIKPKFEEKQQADLVFNLENKINQLYQLEAGESVIIDSKTQNLRLYEDGREDNASITILYEVKITRR